MVLTIMEAKIARQLPVRPLNDGCREWFSSMKTINDLKVFITSRESTCDECGENLGRQAWITLSQDNGALCLSCADLDHLVFLSPGNAALTRRARKHSTLSVVVLKWSRSRKRYERQGLLVEEAALERAEKECLSDKEVRERRREREAKRREEMDIQYIKKFAQNVRQLFPSCPPGREVEIAEHACMKYSGRVGRSAAAKNLEENSIRLAVIAHIRHVETPYDWLLAEGQDRRAARVQVEEEVDQTLNKWEH
jgi:hypothetical protein